MSLLNRLSVNYSPDSACCQRFNSHTLPWLGGTGNNQHNIKARDCDWRLQRYSCCHSERTGNLPRWAPSSISLLRRGPSWSPLSHSSFCKCLDHVTFMIMYHVGQTSPLLLSFIVLHRYSSWNYGIFKKLGIPGPKPVPFFGTMLAYKKVGRYNCYMNITVLEAGGAPHRAEGWSDISEGGY